LKKAGGNVKGDDERAAGKKGMFLLHPPFYFDKKMLQEIRCVFYPFWNAHWH